MIIENMNFNETKILISITTDVDEETHYFNFKKVEGKWTAANKRAYQRELRDIARGMRDNRKNGDSLWKYYCATTIRDNLKKAQELLNDELQNLEQHIDVYRYTYFKVYHQNCEHTQKIKETDVKLNNALVTALRA